MAFTGQSSALKLSFIMDFVLVLLGLIIVGSLSIHATQSGIVTLAAIVLSFMDYITWKRSENYKGKRASVALYLDYARRATEAARTI
ncbi:hypothetical protein BGZ94_006797 [Podila epigama]|nr:hypothetical protein BGZ94_006797 [Podila epigama]